MRRSVRSRGGGGIRRAFRGGCGGGDGQEASLRARVPCFVLARRRNAWKAHDVPELPCASSLQRELAARVPRRPRPVAGMRPACDAICICTYLPSPAPSLCTAWIAYTSKHRRVRVTIGRHSAAQSDAAAAAAGTALVQRTPPTTPRGKMSLSGPGGGRTRMSPKAWTGTTGRTGLIRTDQ